MQHGLQQLLLAACLFVVVQCDEGRLLDLPRSLLANKQKVGNPYGKPLRSELIIAMPSTGARSAIISASRASRKGVRTVVVTDKGPELVAHAKKTQMRIKTRKEVYGSYKGSKSSPPLPRNRLQEIRVALTPFLTNQTLGTRSFKWILAGHDDTVFLVENVLNMLKDLNHREPYFITDNIWFKDSTADAAVHPSPEAPSCVPCRKSYRDLKMQSDEKGAVSCIINDQAVNVRCQCTVKELVHGDGSQRGTLDFREQSDDRAFRVHTGGGVILSAGLFRQGSFDDVHAWMQAQTDMSADALLTGAVWEVLGIAPSNPGFSICRRGAHVFDPGWRAPRQRAAEDGGLDGGNDPAGVIQRFQWALDGDARCDTRCIAHMNTIVSVHVRSQFAAQDIPGGGAWDNSPPRYNATTTLIPMLTTVAEAYLYQRWRDEKVYEAFI